MSENITTLENGIMVDEDGIKYAEVDQVRVIDKFQVFIDGNPKKKFYKNSAYGSARCLGLKRNFKKYAIKNGFTEIINDDSSYFEYSYQNDTGNIMSLRKIGQIEESYKTLAIVR